MLSQASNFDVFGPKIPLCDGSCNRRVQPTYTCRICDHPVSWVMSPEAPYLHTSGIQMQVSLDERPPKRFYSGNICKFPGFKHDEYPHPNNVDANTLSGMNTRPQTLLEERVFHCPRALELSLEPLVVCLMQANLLAFCSISEDWFSKLYMALEDYLNQNNPT